MTQMDQVLPAEPQQRARPRRTLMIVIAVICIAALVSTVLYLALRQTAAPQPYSGPQTARDVLNQVVTDPSGGVWAVGERIDRDLSQANTQPISTFVLHLEEGRWMLIKEFPWNIPDGFQGIGRIVMVSPDEGWAVGFITPNRSLILHYDHGNWSTESVHPIGQLVDIAMVSPSEGWAVGGTPGNGNVLLLHYSAGAWSQVVSQTAGLLQSVAMVSASEGWAAGNGGTTLLHYADGGWTDVSVPPSALPRAIAMVSASEGWAVGESGTILHYTGGVWSKIASPTNASLEAIAMVSPTEGWAVGDPITSRVGVILHYSGGAWAQVPSPTSQPLSSITMVSASEGWAVGLHGTILHYTGGIWTVVNGLS